MDNKCFKSMLENQRVVKVAIFNPQNCADYLESMKNKNVSREAKLMALKKYNEEKAKN